MKLGILGGGLTGLTIRYFLEHDSEILEKESECGGLCRSIREEGFTFDQGGHILFSKDPEILNFIERILGDNVERRRRNNKVYYDKRFVKYPFENGLSELSKEDNFECLYYYLKNDSPSPTNLKEWLYFTFGKGIAGKYLIPYNEKIWKFDTGKMGLEWVERIPKPPLEDVIKSSLGIETEGYLHQLFYLYPRHGGIQSLTRALELAKDGPITTNFTVNKITKEGTRWVVYNSNGRKVFDKLISTIPIFDLVKCMDSAPEAVLDSLSRLKYNSIIVVMLGLNKDNLPDYTAVYFPGNDTLYHRVCFMSNFSENNAPSGKTSLVAEITTKEGDAVWNMDERALVDAAMATLGKERIIDKNSVSFSKVYKAKYAYIIYDREYKKNLSVVKKYIADQEIILCGRFAEFEYINMDECIRRGKSLAEKLNELY